MQTVLLADNDAFRDRLLPGENVIWSGQPAQGFTFSGRDIFMIPFSVFWAGFAMFWEYTVAHTNAPLLFRLWGIPFVLIGLYLVIGRFWLDSWLRGRMRYAVTTQRILILRPPPFGSFIAIELRRLPDATLNESANGRGTIRFGQPAAMWGRNNWTAWSPALDPTPQFLAIDDARQVFDLVQRESAQHA